MPQRTSRSASSGNLLPWTHRVSSFLLAAVFLATLAAVITRADTDQPEAWLVLLATVSTLVALARRLPAQNVWLVAAMIAVIGGGAHALGAKTGIPFGPILFGSSAGL